LRTVASVGGLFDSKVCRY